jgi:hypothetical protein
VQQQVLEQEVLEEQLVALLVLVYALWLVDQLEQWSM